MKTSTRILILSLSAVVSVEAQYTISTLAGGSPPPTPVAAIQASIGSPTAVAADSVGNSYFATQNCVFKIDAHGTMTLVAGTSRPGYSGDGGPAVDAQLNLPVGLAVDSEGNLYIAEWLNRRIRKVSAGIITTVAGNGLGGFNGDGGPATSATLYSPAGVAVDSGGNLYILDTYNFRIRKVSPTGILTTVAGDGSSGFSGDGGAATSAQFGIADGIAIDTRGNLYIADAGNNRVREVSAAGIMTTVAGDGTFGYSGDGAQAVDAELVPSGVAVDASGNVLIADSVNNRIRKVSQGIITTVAGTAFPGFSNDGGPAFDSQLNEPVAVATDINGNFYIADSRNYRVREVSAAGVINTIAGNGNESYSGDGGAAVSAQLAAPSGVAVDAAGNVYIADAGNNRVRKVSRSGIIITVAGNGFAGYSGDGGPAINAKLSSPSGVAIDSAGNIYISDTGNSRIREVSSSGLITTFAGTGASGYSGDGGEASDAMLGQPCGIATDSNGNVYFADRGTNRVRRIAPGGIITTVAGNGLPGYAGDGGAAASAELNYPNGVVADAAGNVYIADLYNNRIRKVSAGIITTVVGTGTQGFSGDGGPAAAAQIASPYAVAFDAAGDLLIADFGTSRVRAVSTAGIISTIAGGGSETADGGPATLAEFDFLEGIAADSNGRIYTADAGYNSIRLLTKSAAACTYSLSSASFSVPPGGENVIVTLTTAADCTWVVTGVPSWILMGSTSGSGTGPATLYFDVYQDSGAPRSAQVTVAGVLVTFSQSSDAVLVNPGGVVSNAGYTSPVAPGSIASVFGNFPLSSPFVSSSLPLPTSLGGLSFQFPTDSSVPLLYSGVGQANIQIPWELSGLQQTTISAALSGQASPSETVALATYAPSIFTTNGTGAGQGAIQDNATGLFLNPGNPATQGVTVAVISCTGLGPVTNQPTTGSPGLSDPLSNTTTPPTVTIGGIPAPVKYAGLAPGYVGLYQVNVLVPTGITPGSAVPLILSIGGVESNTVTLAVQ